MPNVALLCAHSTGQARLNTSRPISHTASRTTLKKVPLLGCFTKHDLRHRHEMYLAFEITSQISRVEMGNTRC